MQTAFLLYETVRSCTKLYEVVRNRTKLCEPVPDCTNCTIRTTKSLHLVSNPATSKSAQMYHS